MSLRSHEGIGRVGRAGRGCYEDPREDVRNKSCVSCSWTVDNDTTHGQTGSTTLQQQTPANQVSAWQAGRGSRLTRPTRTTCYKHPCENVRNKSGVSARILTRMSRGCYTENGPVEFMLYVQISASDSRENAAVGLSGCLFVWLCDWSRGIACMKRPITMNFSVFSATLMYECRAYATSIRPSVRPSVCLSVCNLGGL